MTVQLITHKPDRIIALEIDGWIDAEDIDRIIKIIEPRIDAGEKLRILCYFITMNSDLQ